MDDAIVAEVRAAREELLARAGGTLAALAEYLRRRERAAERQPVILLPTNPVTSISTG